MNFELGIFFFCVLIIAVTALVFLYIKLTGRRMKKSRYGHTFDFSRMPNQKIKTNAAAGKKVS